MAAPTYVNAFTVDFAGASSFISITPASGTTDGDIILNYVMSRPDTGYTLGTITGTTAGGTKIAQQTYATAMNLAVFWQRVSGTPPATMAYNVGANDLARAIATVTIRGCVATGNPYDAYAAEAGGVGSTYSISSLTTLGSDRLLFSGILAWVSSSQYIYPPSTYTQQTQIGLGSGYYFQGSANTLVRPTAGATPTDSGSMLETNVRMGYTFAMVPPGGYANKVNGVASANIGKVNSVATANIGNVIGV